MNKHDLKRKFYQALHEAEELPSSEKKSIMEEILKDIEFLIKNEETNENN